jgi:riboflavin biosynthesis pyrimidine reductase
VPAVSDEALDRVWAALTAQRPFPPPGRPCMALTMVMSVDGRTAIDGRVGALTGPVDQGLLRRLRAHADAVLVGASTVRAEGYGSLLPGDAQPLLAVASRSLDFAPDAPVLADTASPLVLLTTGEGELPEAAREVHRIDLPTIGAAVERLREEHGVHTIVCEGGAALASALFDAGLVDELFVTLSPLLVHDDSAPTNVRGRGEVRPLELVGHAAVAGFVFSRYAVAP